MTKVTSCAHYKPYININKRFKITYTYFSLYFSLIFSPYIPKDCTDIAAYMEMSLTHIDGFLWFSWLLDLLLTPRTEEFLGFVFRSVWFQSLVKLGPEQATNKGGSR